MAPRQVERAVTALTWYNALHFQHIYTKKHDTCINGRMCLIDIADVKSN